jgi:hypothetical protein
MFTLKISLKKPYLFVQLTSKTKTNFVEKKKQQQKTRKVCPTEAELFMFTDFKSRALSKTTRDF